MKLLICRTIIIYLCVLFAMRLMGKRQLGELQPEELVSTILISNLASISIESEEVPITSSLIPLFLIAALELLGSVLSFRSQKFFNFLSGRPKTVILDGQIDQKALRMLRLTTADLMEALRGKNIFDPREVSYAVIETNGTLSAALRPEKEPARLADLQLKVTHTNATIPFVLDGQVLEDNLRWCGKDRAWLERTAQANTLLPEEILLLIGNETEDYFLLKKENRRAGGSFCGVRLMWIYACFAILAVLCSVAFYSSWMVQGFADVISADLDTAAEAIRNADYPAARQALADGADRCDQMRTKMNHLLRTADFTELEAALRAADGHLEMGAPEEAFGELRRAQVQVETLEWLSHRLV